jgi:hypothetical protein
MLVPQANARIEPTKRAAAQGRSGSRRMWATIAQGVREDHADARKRC